MSTESAEPKSWTFLYSCLAKACTPVLLPVLDTIIFSATVPLRPVYWVYTDQDNCVRRKSIAKLTLDDVIKACADSLSASKGKLGERKACFLISHQGRKLVSLLQLWNVRMRSEEEWVEGVQVCSVAGRPFDDSVYFQTWSGKQTGAVTKRLLEAYYTEEAPNPEEAVNNRIEEATKTVVAAIEAVHGGPVLHLRLSFLVERGTMHLDARIPWLLFSESCVVTPSAPAPPVVFREPELVFEPQLLRSTGLRSTVSALANKQDARLAVVTLSPVHFPKVATRPKVLPDSHSRPSPNRSKRTNPRHLLSRPATRGSSTSHSCIMPSTDMDQADLTVLPASYSSNIVSPGVEIRTNPVSDKTEVSLQVILQREQSKAYSPHVKISHRDVGTPAPEEDIAGRTPGSRERRENTLPAVLESGGRKAAGGSRAESPEIKYISRQSGSNRPFGLHTAAPARRNEALHLSISASAQEVPPNPAGSPARDFPQLQCPPRPSSDRLRTLHRKVLQRGKVQRGLLLPGTDQTAQY